VREGSLRQRPRGTKGQQDGTARRDGDEVAIDERPRRRLDEAVTQDVRIAKVSAHLHGCRRRRSTGQTEAYEPAHLVRLRIGGGDSLQRRDEPPAGGARADEGASTRRTNARAALRTCGRSTGRWRRARSEAPARSEPGCQCG